MKQETKILENDIPEELQQDLLKTYKTIDLENYGKVTSSTIERPAMKIAKDIKGQWEKTYTYKIVEMGDVCSLRAVVETTTYKS